MSALLAKLQSKGLLDQTLVVLGTDGREHRDETLSCLLAGAEIKNGHAQRGTPTATTSRGTHGRNSAVLDQAMSAVLGDLQAKGLLGETLVVLGTESGRTPRINDNEGRDHHREAFRCLLAGAGIGGGVLDMLADLQDVSPKSQAECFQY